jgi:hypothetical protein
MPIDSAGTAPGLTPKQEVAPKIHMRCKNPDCDSIVAIELKLTGQDSGHRLYQCCKCKVTRGIAVGGGINL